MYFLNRAKQNKMFVLLFLLSLTLIGIAIFAPIIATHDPIVNDYENILLFSNAEHWLGTDQIGRDIFSRLIYGGRTTLFIVFTVIAIISFIGITLGILSGYVGGIVDHLLNGWCEVVLSIPEPVFIIALVSVLGGGVFHTILAMSLISWTEYMRVARGLVMSVKEQTYVKASRMMGLNDFQILTRMIFPNIFPYLIVNMTQDIGSKILTLSGLSLLGLAAQPPIPEWGFMLSEGRRYMQSAPWLIIYPGIMIVLHVVVFNLFGDSLRDILDPKFKKINYKKGDIK